MGEDALMQPYCAKLCYPKLEPFIFGTALVRVKAPEHEAMAAIEHEATTVLPSGFRVLELLPGTLIFCPSKEK